MGFQWILVCAIALVALALRIYPAYPAVFGGEEVNFLETDAWYHVRLVENQVRNYPWRVTLDPYAASGGQFVPIAPFYDTVTSTAVVLLYGSHAATAAIERVAAYGPPVFGALAVIVAWALGRQLFGPWPGLIGAAVLATMPGHFLERTMLGFVDHHALEALLALLTLYLLARACAPRNGSAPSALQAALTGLVLGLYLLTWGSGAFLVAALGLWLLVITVLARSPSDIANVARVLLVSSAVALLLVLVFQDPRMYRYGSQVLALVGLATSSLALLVVCRYARAFPSRATMLIGLTAAVAGGALFVWFWNLGLMTQLVGDLLRLRPDPSRMVVLEARPLFLYSGSWQWSQPWELFGTGFYVGLVALLWFTATVARDGRPGDALLWTFAVMTLVSTIGQNRFGYYLVPAFSVLGGWLGHRVLMWGGWFRNRTADARQLDVPLQREIALLAVVAVMFAPNLAASARLGSRTVGIAASWLDAAFWLRQHTPEPFAAQGGDDYYHVRYGSDVATPDYTVMNWWDYGYVIAQRAHRVPVTNPTQERAVTSAQFWAETDEARAMTRLADAHARYVVADWELPFRYELDGRLMGRFQSVLEWARAPHDEYYDICYRLTNGAWTPVWVFRESYYRSMTFRLMVAGGAAMAPRKVTVIATTDRVDTLGTPFHELVSEQTFDTLAEAERVVSSAVISKMTIVGLDPRQSPFPLEPLTSLELLHDVLTPGAPRSEPPWVRVFGVRGGPPGVRLVR